jgi:hypothetical protein
VTSPRDLPPGVLQPGDAFWNLRGSFKIGGVIEIGTHCSLVRRESGGYLLLDACELSAEARRWLDERTDGGAAIDAVLHLHPFHTLSVRDAHARYPRARLHGTARHRDQAPELPWDPLTTEDPRLHALYAEDLELTVPRGVALVPGDPNVHFSSVLAIHPASRTLHVDDTLVYVRLPRLLRAVEHHTVRFHPTLSRALERQAGAAAEFRAWARSLIDRCATIDNLCAAHSAARLARSRPSGPSLAALIERALLRVEPVLRAHELRAT